MKRGSPLKRRTALRPKRTKPRRVSVGCFRGWARSKMLEWGQEQVAVAAARVAARQRIAKWERYFQEMP